MQWPRPFACALVGATLFACGRTVLVSDRSTADDAGTAIDASPTDMQADSGPPQFSFDAATLPAVPVTCDNESFPDPSAASPPSPGARCDTKPRLLVGPASFPVFSKPGTVAGSAESLAVTPAGLYYKVTATESHGASSAAIAGALLRVPLAGGQPTPVACGYLLGKLLVYGHTLIVGAWESVWPSSGPGAVLVVPLAGGPARVLLALSNDEMLIGEPATDGRFVFFPDQQQGDTTMSSPFGILAVPLNPEAAAPPVRITTTSPVDAVGALDQQLVFVQPQGAVQSVPLPPTPGSPVKELGTGQAGGAESMIPCGNDLCWVSTSDLVRLDPVAGGPTVVSTVQGGLGDLAFDGTNFYATAYGSAPGGAPGLVRIPAAGGSAIVLVKGDVLAVAVDDQCVYWSGASGIFSLAKTAQGPFDQ